MAHTQDKTVHVIPAVRYRDANRMIEWLKQAFGFREHAVYRDDAGTVMHAELVFGNGMIMIGTAQENPRTQGWYQQPDETGNRVTASLCLIVPDCDPVYASAKAAGATVLLDLQTMDYGGKAFSVRDPEGQIWSIGEYDPWANRA